MPLLLNELPGTMTWHGYAKVIVKALLYLQSFGFSKGDLGPEVKIPTLLGLAHDSKLLAFWPISTH